MLNRRLKKEVTRNKIKGTYYDGSSWMRVTRVATNNIYIRQVSECVKLGCCFCYLRVGDVSRESRTCTQTTDARFMRRRRHQRYTRFPLEVFPVRRGALLHPESFIRRWCGERKKRAIFAEKYEYAGKQQFENSILAVAVLFCTLTWLISHCFIFFDVIILPYENCVWYWKKKE